MDNDKEILESTVKEHALIIKAILCNLKSNRILLNKEDFDEGKKFRMKKDYFATDALVVSLEDLELSKKRSEYIKLISGEEK